MLVRPPRRALTQSKHSVFNRMKSSPQQSGTESEVSIAITAHGPTPSAGGTSHHRSGGAFIEKKKRLHRFEIVVKYSSKSYVRIVGANQRDDENKIQEAHKSRNSVTDELE
ncbi:hypothetical protein AVEN_243432-1 [Araneus ventricosus]|uniref:Uncharacterized protein n=1 Tax=Araneus ventricosus TaxID=182803 RepID=A0A4Y2TV10_ARAVE|nr:hypothetical protein AVEN_243432-1 [Araneus ventricosus]